jgi:transposase-like protein
MSKSETIGKTSNVSQWLLKRLSRMYESGISISDIAEELKLDRKSVERLLMLLGYALTKD